MQAHIILTFLPILKKEGEMIFSIGKKRHWLFCLFAGALFLGGSILPNLLMADETDQIEKLARDVTIEIR